MAFNWNSTPSTPTPPPSFRISLPKLPFVSVIRGGFLPLGPRVSRFAPDSTGTLRIDGKTFNVPLLLGASYAKSRDLTWLFGARVNAYSEHAVLPFVGVRWQFAPDWSLGLAFPRSGVQWRVSPDLTLDAGIGFQGGTYRITDNIGTPAGAVGQLANTFVDYREIRVGFGAEFALNRRLSFRIDAGAFTDRRFDYFDRDYTLDGDGGVFAAVALRTAL